MHRRARGGRDALQRRADDDDDDDDELDAPRFAVAAAFSDSGPRRHRGTPSATRHDEFVPLSAGGGRRGRGSASGHRGASPPLSKKDRKRLAKQERRSGGSHGGGRRRRGSADHEQEEADLEDDDDRRSRHGGKRSPATRPVLSLAEVTASLERITRKLHACVETAGVIE